MFKASRKGFISQKSREHETELWSDTAYVSYSINWEGLLISDQFLWPIKKNSVSGLKMFAANYLSDYLKKDISSYSRESIESKYDTSLIIIVDFTNQVANIISKEIQL